MREQGNNAWGLTVSRRFETATQATGAVSSLKQAGFREEEIRVWQHKSSTASYEDRLERIFEGMLGGAVISAMIGFFVTVAYYWANSEPIGSIGMEDALGITLAATVIGAVVSGIAVTLISPRFSFSHPHPTPDELPSVVTVTVGDRESEAKKVFGS